MKRGEGSPVANFILMFALFIVVYLIILPPAAKEDIVYTGQEYDKVEGKLLFSQSPGLVRPFLKEVISTKLARSLAVSTSVFSTKDEELMFDLQELNNLNQLSLIFLIQEGTGKLVLNINGQEFYNDYVTVNDLPIEIPLKALRAKDNVLTISASSPGLRFLSANRYALKDIQIIKKFAVEHQREARSFIITPGESKDLVRSVLLFFINCLKVRDLGSLNIYLNGKEISNRFLTCDAGETELEINPDDIYEGENTLEFEVDKGEYILEQVFLEHELETEDYPKYFFTLQRGEFFAVED